MMTSDEEEEEEGEEVQRDETGDLFIYFPSLSQLPNRIWEEKRSDFEKWVIVGFLSCC